MNYLVNGLFLFIYLSGLGFSDPSVANSPSVKVQVVHTHEVTAGHDHHHDFNSDAVTHEEAPVDHDHGPDEHKESIPHSHDRFVAMSSGFCVQTSALDPVVLLLLPQDSEFSINNESRPPRPLLQSIFRPPIYFS